MITQGKWKVYKTNATSRHIYVGDEGNETVLAAVQNEDFESNAALIADAGTVYNETGFTPSQLAEQRTDLLAACENALNNMDFADCPHSKMVIEQAIAAATT